ncbi:MAG: NUDIX domain-containing protein [Candidatus Pacearchaeota archaeon]|jgi:ADP-ribose pyrophosphatase YjhB (NUDIX family)
MKKQPILEENKRRKILIELEAGSKKFVELKRILKLESNLLSYNLNILIKEGLVEKTGVYYLLNDSCKHLMPYIRSDNNLIPLTCVATIVMSKGKILIRKKDLEPEKGKSIFIGGKVGFGEDIFDAVRRHVREKVNIEIKNLRTICINNYVSKNNLTNSHFIVFFVIAEPIGNPKNAEWKYSNKIKGKMFPDNKFIIKKMLNNKSIKIINSIYDEKKDFFKVVNIS